MVLNKSSLYMTWFETQPVKYSEYADAKAIKKH